MGGWIGVPFHAAAASLEIAEQQGDWDGNLSLGRLSKDGTVTDLVLQLNIADKPETTYANVVYQVFARVGSDRYLVYNSRGARLLERESGTVAVVPEVVAISNLYDAIDRNGDLSTVELEVSAEIRYDVRGGRRDQRITWTQTRNYSRITEITSITQLTTTASGASPSSANPLPANPSSGGQQDTVTLANGYRVTFLGVTYRGNTSTWTYRMEELPSAQDLSNWVLGLPSCATVISASPNGELVNPDPNARISGIKWQPGGGFV